MLSDQDKLLRKNLPVIRRIVSFLQAWPRPVVTLQELAARLGIVPQEIVSLFNLVGVRPSGFFGQFEPGRVISAFTLTQVWVKNSADRVTPHEVKWPKSR
jgi:hypothetical protein